MTRYVTLVAIVTAALCGSAAEAPAQSRVHRAMEVPKAEVAMITGLWSLDSTGHSGTGGRLTINRSDWFGLEGSLDIKNPDRYSPAAETLTIVNARAQVFDPDEGMIVFVTAGLAFGTGLDRTLVPMTGIGTGRWTAGVISWRGEIQVFRGGPMHDGSHSRLLFSIAIGLR